LEVADTVKIAVCDDEKNIRAYLVPLIKKQGAECSIVEFASAGEYLADGNGNLQAADHHIRYGL